MKREKIAIVHDELMRRGGAEKVALALHYAYPDAPIYTLCYNPKLTYPEFKNTKVITSVFQKIGKSEFMMKLLFYPFGYWSMRLLRIKGYDKVILSSTFASKYANFDSACTVINYCHNPFRLAWYPQEYQSYKDSTGLKRLFFDFFIKRLRVLDFKHTRRADFTLVNSNVVFGRVKKIYKIEPEKVIHPPVDLEHFRCKANVVDMENAYLVVSRLVPYKKVDLVIEAFNENGKKLIIVGSGGLKKSLSEMSKGNIEFKENLSNAELNQEYLNARAVICPQLEDFGIVPLESNASGTPVIALGKGGFVESMIPVSVENKAEFSTAVFFNEQNCSSLNEAIEYFETVEAMFSPAFIRKHAENFSVKGFSEKIKEFVSELDRLKSSNKNSHESFGKIPISLFEQSK